MGDEENENLTPMVEEGVEQDGAKKVDILNDGDMILHIQGGSNFLSKKRQV